MEKISKIIALIGVLFVSFVALVVIIYKDIVNFEIVYSPEPSYISGVIYLITSVISFLMVVKLTMQIKNANSIIANYLLFYFIFTGMSALINSIMSFFNFVDTNLNNLVTGTVYFFLCLGFINLEIFNIEVFYEGLTKAKNKKIVLVVIIGVSIFSGYIFKDMLFSSISEEKMIFGLLLLLIAMMIYGQLTNNSLQLFKYFKKQKIKFKTRGFFSLMLSGFFLILGFFAILVYQLTKDPSESTDNWMNWLSMFLVLGGYIFLYLGFLNTSRK